MVYVDSQGNVVEKRPSLLSYILSFFSFFVLFFQSLFGISSSNAGSNDNRDHLRRTGGGAAVGGGRWPGSGGPGGPGRDGGTRRQIGRLPQSSGMSCPPMGGGG